MRKYYTVLKINAHTEHIRLFNSPQEVDGYMEDSGFEPAGRLGNRWKRESDGFYQEYRLAIINVPEDHESSRLRHLKMEMILDKLESLVSRIDALETKIATTKIAGGEGCVRNDPRFK